MKANLPVKLTTAALLIFSFTSHTATAASTGRINFVGAIVEDGCDVRQLEQTAQVNMTCPTQGKMVEQTVSLAQLDTGSIRSDNNVAVNVKYLNPQKTLAIVSMSYN